MSKVLNILSFASPFVVTVDKETSLVDVIKIMADAEIRHVPVVDNDEPVGIISERDLQVFRSRKSVVEHMRKVGGYTEQDVKIVEAGNVKFKQIS